MRRLEQRYSLLDATQPDSRWRRGEFWQRRLNNKYNSREFAKRHGVDVPELYWKGRSLRDLPWGSLPSQIVVRPCWGAVRKGVYVLDGDRDLLSDRRFEADELQRTLAPLFSGFPRHPVLVEEFLRTEQGRYALPIEYKFHVFRGHIGAIEVIERATGKKGDATSRFFTSEWVRIEEPIRLCLPEGGPLDPPACLHQLVESARTLGGAYGTYVRVDLYATERGCVFGEFSSIPNDGKDFTEWADAYFEECWSANCPDEL